MIDVTNPGVVSVAGETYGNPDPNGGTSQAVPRQDDSLVQAGGQGFRPAANGVTSSAFPTPDDVVASTVLFVPPVGASFPQPALEVDVADQDLGDGRMVPVNPANPAAGFVFRDAADFIVVGPAESFQTNATDEDLEPALVTAVLDADNLPLPAGPATARYYLRVTAPLPLTSYPVSLLGRLVTFDDDTPTPADQGACRVITSYGADFVVINRDDPTPSNGDVPVMTTPSAGDRFTFDASREGSEQVNTEGGSVDVVIFPPPPTFVPGIPQALLGGQSVNQSTGPQPGAPIITSGVVVPTAVNVNVADQDAVVGLPRNVFV